MNERINYQNEKPTILIFIFIAYFLWIVDGVWSEWAPWSACSKSCDSGLQQRYRECGNPAPAGDGLDCPTNVTGVRAKLDMENKTCNTDVCDRELIIFWDMW